MAGAIFHQQTGIEQKSSNTDSLTMGNSILEQIVPALERKDAALDKIAEVLDNILRTENLTNQQLKSIALVLDQRCQALDLVKAIQSFEQARVRQEKVDKLRDDNALEGIEKTLSDIVKTFENGKGGKTDK